jgi:hypothetical protein
MGGASTIEAESGWVEGGRRRSASGLRLVCLGKVCRSLGAGGQVCLGEEGVVGDDTRLTAEALLLQQKKGTELDEGGEAAVRHMRDGVLEALVETTQDVVDKLAVLDARAKVPSVSAMRFICEVYSTTERSPWLKPWNLSRRKVA